MFNANETINGLTTWIRDWFETNGPGATAVVGISGGKDSTVVATLLARALGTKRVHGVIMPDGKMKDFLIAKDVIEHLGIKWSVVDISHAVNGLYKGLGGTAKDMPEMARVNTPARMRMSTLYAIAAGFPNGGRVANTCNLSEDWIGYATKFGDGAGDFSPLSNLTVTEVRQIGHALGLPAKWVDKTPEDGLCGLTDEESFGFTYDILDRYIRTGEIDDPKLGKRIDKMRAANRHKLEFMAQFNPNLCTK